MQNMKGRLTLTFAVRLHVDVFTTPYLSIKILKLCFKRLHLVCARFVCNFRRTSYQIKGMKAHTVRDIISVLRALFFLSKCYTAFETVLAFRGQFPYTR